MKRQNEFVGNSMKHVKKLVEVRIHVYICIRIHTIDCVHKGIVELMCCGILLNLYSIDNNKYYYGTHL
jgi:hypothetical protein